MLKIKIMVQASWMIYCVSQTGPSSKTTHEETNATAFLDANFHYLRPTTSKRMGTMTTLSTSYRNDTKTQSLHFETTYIQLNSFLIYKVIRRFNTICIQGRRFETVVKVKGAFLHMHNPFSSHRFSSERLECLLVSCIYMYILSSWEDVFTLIYK